jgi:hypothetical protein
MVIYNYNYDKTIRNDRNYLIKDAGKYGASGLADYNFK